jgi:cell division protein FtsQ
MQSLIARRPVSRVRRDPAPSKWAYRVQRWMLTPYVRSFVLKGIPTLMILGAGALWLSHEPNRQAVIGQLTHLREGRGGAREAGAAPADVVLRHRP